MATKNDVVSKNKLSVSNKEMNINSKNNYIFTEEESEYFESLKDIETLKIDPGYLVLDNIYLKYKRCINPKGCNILINIKDFWNNTDPHIGFIAIYDDESNNMYMMDFDLKNAKLISLYTKQKESSPELVKSVKLWRTKGNDSQTIEKHIDLTLEDVYLLNEFELYLLSQFMNYDKVSWSSYIPKEKLKGVYEFNENDKYLKITND